MPTGRPTKLTKEVKEQAIAYIEGEYELLGHIIPSAVGLAEVLNVTRTTLYQWAEEDRDGFSYILEKCNEYQHRILISKGLGGDVNPTICKLVLGKHGYHERQEHTGPDGQPMQVEQKVTSVTFTGPDD